MNIRFNYLFLLSFFAFIPLNIWSTTCQEIYQAQAVFANASWNYKDELQFINALNQQDHPTNSSAYKKYAYLIKKLPFSPKQTFDILRIGFNEQIFCNPWPLRMPQIIKRLLSGEFSNSLLREINRYQQENESYSGQASFIFSDYELRSLKKNLEHIPSPFPQEVNIRDTYQQDFTSNFFYFLRKKDGKIFIKPNPKKGNKADIIKFGELEHHQENNKLGNRTEWNLFNNNGGPQLDKGKKIVQFSVASEIVFALDNTGQFHIFKPTEFKTPTKWSSFVGAPIPEKLYIPRGHKTWSLSSSLKIKPEQRRSIEFMHPDDIVHYYEDADNKKIEFGFTTTAYVLSKDGRKIYYWDTGLPANFGRAFTTPHRGNFIAQNLSAQGSTIMVIGLNPEGKYEIYTRMFDYEINGACPGEQHTYQKTQAPIPDRVLGLIEAKRRLPLPGWKKMPDILLGSEDFITTKISIELTGQGNSARMLKVRGSQNGVPGYYQKMLDATQWEFIEATQISDKTFDVYGFDLSHQALYGIDNDMNYQGKILSFSSLSPHKKHYISSIELKKFHYFLGADEPSTIEITTQNKRKLYLRLHTNDAWTLTTQKKRREALIGNKDGEPKPLFGTIIIPQDAWLSFDPQIKYLLHLFEPFHMKMNAFAVLASDEKVVLRSATDFIDMDDDYKSKNLAEVTMEFTREDTQPGYYTLFISQPKFFIKNTEDKNHISSIIEKNQQLLRILKNDKRELRNESLKNGIVATGVNLTFQAGKRALFFSNNDLVNSLRKFVAHAVSQYQNINFSEFFSEHNAKQAIEDAVRHVQTRIKKYSELL